MTIRTLLPVGLTLLTALPAAAWQVRDLGDQRLPGVVGVVMDRETRRPIEGVAVTFTPRRADDSLGVPDRTLTDAEGRFVLPGLADGRYAVALDAFGYRPVEDTVAFRSELGLRVEVEMVPEAVELDPLLVVTEARSRHLQANGFYERRRRGIGRFVTRDEMSARLLTRASDVFRTMPGIRMSYAGHFGEDGVVLMRGGCVADVFVDGVPTVSPFPVDALLGSGDLDAVEVYHPSELPARFRATDCGAVLFWTRTPIRGQGDPWSWKKFLVAVGFLGTTLFLLH